MSTTSNTPFVALEIAECFEYVDLRGDHYAARVDEVNPDHPEITSVEHFWTVYGIHNPHAMQVGPTDALNDSPNFNTALKAARMWAEENNNCPIYLIHNGQRVQQ
jgi:hypothetical protein